MHGNELEVTRWPKALGHEQVLTMGCLAVHWSKVMDLLLLKRVLTKPVKVLAMGCMAYKSQIEPSQLNKNRTPKQLEVPPGGCRVQVCKSGMNNGTVKNSNWLLSSVSK